MGGSTNTVLHLLAAAHEGEIDFTMRDIDRLSRRVPVPVQGRAREADVHLEDVHRAGGVMAILGELDRAGLIHAGAPTVHAASLGEALGALGRRAHAKRRRGRVLPRRARRRSDPDRLQPERAVRRTGSRPRARRHPRRRRTPSRQDGGLAVLYGNIAEDGGIVKTAGVDASILVFSGPARIFESQDAAVEGILGDKVGPATSSSSATRARAAAPACRKCCIRRAI